MNFSISCSGHSTSFKSLNYPLMLFPQCLFKDVLKEQYCLILTVWSFGTILKYVFLLRGRKKKGWKSLRCLSPSLCATFPGESWVWMLLERFDSSSSRIFSSPINVTLFAFNGTLTSLKKINFVFLTLILLIFIYTFAFTYWQILKKSSYLYIVRCNDTGGLHLHFSILW